MVVRLGRSRWLVAAAGSLGLSSLVVLPAAGATASVSAAAAKGIVVTMFSDPGDYIGAGSAQEFDSTNATFSGTVSTGGISLSVSGGTSGTSWSVNINPPLGSSGFKAGYYPKVQRAGFQNPGYAGLDINGDGRGCDTDSGAIDVRDIAVSSSAITRLDLLYEQHCEGATPALFGEIRIGEPNTSGVIVSSGSINWPSNPGLPSGTQGTAVPVYVRNAGATSASVGSASLSGSAASNFRLITNGCSGVVLAPGDACDLYVGFKASTQGPRMASLTLPLGGKNTKVQLGALVRPGTTSLTMASQPGDYIGGGESYSFTGANARFTFLASPQGLEQDLTASDGETWTADMYPASGQILAVGSYLNATRYPFNGTGNGLSVWGDGRGCNTLTGSFKVKQAVFSAVDNSLKNFDGTFIQHCEGAAPALTGEVKYDAESVTAAPAGVTNLTTTVSGSNLNISWTNPASTVYAYTMVRIVPTSAPAGVSPIAGSAVFAGTGTTGVAYSLKAGQAYTVIAYTVDKTGNVSAPVESSLTF